MANSRPPTYEHEFSTQPLDSDPNNQRFTATGRPIASEKSLKNGRAMNALSVSDSMGAGVPNLLPVKFNDNSIISVPVRPAPPYTDGNSDEDDSPIKQDSGKSRFSLSSLRRKSKSKKKEQEFVIKQMTRGEYLKHYAKDEDGKYIGTEEPAADILFSDPKDFSKYRKPAAGDAKLVS